MDGISNASQWFCRWVGTQRRKIVVHFPEKPLVPLRRESRAGARDEVGDRDKVDDVERRVKFLNGRAIKELGLSNHLYLRMTVNDIETDAPIVRRCIRLDVRIAATVEMGKVATEVVALVDTGEVLEAGV